MKMPCGNPSGKVNQVSMALLICMQFTNGRRDEYLVISMIFLPLPTLLKKVGFKNSHQS